MLRFDILTLFPSMLKAVLSESIPRIAEEKGAVEYHLHNFRDHAEGVHQAVDDRPYGGGAGMVLKPEPVFKAVRQVQSLDDRPPHMVLLSPQGRVFNQSVAQELVSRPRILMLCGRYEGFDERIRLGLWSPTRLFGCCPVCWATMQALSTTVLDRDWKQGWRAGCSSTRITRVPPSLKA